MSNRKRETIEDIDADIDQLLGKKVKRPSGASTSTNHSGRSSAAPTLKWHASKGFRPSSNSNGRFGKPPAGSRSASTQASIPPDSDVSEEEGTVQESVVHGSPEMTNESDGSEEAVADDLLQEEDSD